MEINHFSVKAVILIKTMLGWYRILDSPMTWSFCFFGGYYMESLLIIIEELEREKTKLLKEKENNELLLDHISKKIRECEDLIMASKFSISLYKSQIISYKRLLSLKREDNNNLFLVFSDSLVPFYERNIDDFQTKLAKEQRAQKRYVVCHSYWIEQKENYIDRNLEIDKEIKKINEDISSYQVPEEPKIYMLGGIKSVKTGKLED